MLRKYTITSFIALSIATAPLATPAAMAKDKSHGGDRNSLSMQELKDELKMMIIAGHETTSTLLYWAFYALGKHPDVQEKVLQDIQKHSAATQNNNEE